MPVQPRNPFEVHYKARPSPRSSTLIEEAADFFEPVPLDSPVPAHTLVDVGFRRGSGSPHRPLSAVRLQR